MGTINSAQHTTTTTSSSSSSSSFFSSCYSHSFSSSSTKLDASFFLLKLVFVYDDEFIHMYHVHVAHTNNNLFYKYNLNVIDQWSFSKGYWATVNMNLEFLFSSNSSHVGVEVRVAGWLPIPMVDYQKLYGRWSWGHLKSFLLFSHFA